MSTRSLIVFLLTAVLLMGVGACRQGPTPEPTPGPETASPWPSFSVLSSTVEFRQKEAEELVAVEPGTERTVEAGANIVVGDSGHAVLLWEDFLTNELLPEADTLLSLSVPDQREVLLDQASGTARYVLQGEDEAARVEVKAQWTEILADEGVADFFVSLVPGPEPAVWVVVRQGAAKVTRDDAMITVHEGEAAAFLENGPMPEPIAVDLETVMAWYDGVVNAEGDGTPAASIVSAVFQCEVDDDVALRSGPSEDADEISDLLPEKTALAVSGRNLDGSWVYVRVIDTGDTGWLPVSELDCIGPVLLVTMLDSSETSSDEDEEEATEPATQAPPPTRVIYITATLPPPPTPVATLTPAGEVKIKFWADDTDIDKGDCTNVHWETENINQVYFEGEGVPGNSSREVCPTSDTTYTLEVHLRDGSKETRTVTINVDDEEEKPTNTPVPQEATAPPQPEVTNTAYVPATQPPQPTAEPTQEPGPTEVP